MEATVKVVGEVASSNADLAGQKIQIASSNIGQLSGGITEYVSNTAGSAATALDSIAGQAGQAVQAVVVPEPAVTAAAVQDVAVTFPDAAAPVIESAAAVAPGVPSGVDLSDAPDAIKAIWDNRPQ